MTEKEIILYCINNRKPLPKLLQIKILKLQEIQEKGLEDYGLCFMLETTIRNLAFEKYNYSLTYDYLSFIIPSFNVNNALNRTDSVNLIYWWSDDEEGNIQRIKFLKRMIKELEEQI